jgi:hypothetical protein
MSSSRPRASPAGGGRIARRFLFTRRNLVLLAAAVAVLIAGYVTLSAGHASAAAVILVLGYCVLFPIGIAL